MSYINEYKQAFNTCYPQKKVDVKIFRQRGENIIRHRIIIDGDAGDISLTEAEMRSATRDFNRGR
jgi:hypothetical protein